MEKEGCSYWGNLYIDIFEKNFELDEEALERRVNVPPEIQEQGAAAVANYLKELEKGEKHLNEARIIILGEKGAGKTCLARKLKNPNAKQTTDKESTVGVETSLWKPIQDDINIHIWDFAGHVITHAVHQLFLSERCLYILVYDGRTERRNQLEYWLNHVKNYGGDSKVFILVNKRDPHPPEIPINTLRSQGYPIVEIDTFSILDDMDELEKFRKKVLEFMKNNPSWDKQKISTKAFEVKEALEKRFTEGEEFISLDEFEKIATEKEAGNNNELLEQLNALGICLRYEKIGDVNTLVLNPDWISHGIYKIINWVQIHGKKKYLVSLSDFPTIFSSVEDAVRYSSIKMHKFLYELMKQPYELAYETESKKSLIIPHLLHVDQPKVLPDFPMSESLICRYITDQPLPLNTITRFIVRHNEEIKKEGNDFLVWRYGVVLEDRNGSIALVMESEERIISVWVTGKEKSAYLNTLRDTLNNIFEKYKSWNPKLEYKIQRFGQIPDHRMDAMTFLMRETENNNPLWLNDRKILNHYVNNRPYYDDISNMDIPMNNTVNIYNISTDNLILGGQGNLIDRSIQNTFNIKDCNINLQGHLNDLAGLIKKKGEIEDAEILEEAAEALSEVEQCKTPEELKKKGIPNKLRRILSELEDENSKLHKTVKGIKNGINIAQDIAKGYNAVAQWCGLPQVPKPFLGKE